MQPTCSPTPAWATPEWLCFHAHPSLKCLTALAGLAPQRCQAHWTGPPLRGSALLQPLARMGASVTGIEPEQNNLQAAVLHAESDVELAERLDYQAVTAEHLASTGVFVILLASSSWECSVGCRWACCFGGHDARQSQQSSWPTQVGRLCTLPVIPNHLGPVAVQQRSAAGRGTAWVCVRNGRALHCQSAAAGPHRRSFAGPGMRSSVRAACCPFKATGGAGMLPAICSRAGEQHKWAVLRDSRGWPLQQGSWPAQMSCLL